MIIQNATVNGHSLVLGQLTGSQITIPTGSEGVDAVSFTFSGSDWNTFTTRKAQFWIDESEIYESALNNNGVAMIPQAILNNPGIVHMAVKGISSREEVISTFSVAFMICRGSFSEANAPTPSQSLFNAAVTEAVTSILASIIDGTLTMQGKAADAKSTGNAIGSKYELPPRGIPGADIADHAVSNAKLSQMAAMTVKGNANSDSGTAQDISAADFRRMFAMTPAGETTDGTSGFVPAPPAGGNKRYLSADGTWDEPAATRNATMAFSDIPLTAMTLRELLNLLGSWYLEIKGKVSKNQGASNAGKLFVVGTDGYVTLKRLSEI